MVDVIVPEVGESITEGLLVEWFKEDGALVAVDDQLFELETDKITLSVEAEEGGLLKIVVPAGESVKIGQKVATIDTKARAEEKPATPPAGMEQAQEKLAHGDDLSPAVRRLVEEKDLDPAKIKGTGKQGRVTKEDVLAHIDDSKKKPQAKEAKAALPPKERPVAKEKAAVAPAPVPAEQRQTRVPLSPMRKRIAEKLLSAQQNAAILTTFNEIDMTRVFEMRAQFQDAFVEKHGIKLGFMSFFVKAVVDALKLVPEVGAQIQGDEIVYNHIYDIGVAVGTDKGLVVPVVRDVDQLDFAGIEKAIAELAGKAQQRTLSLDDLSGGIFTVSNGGIYGNLLSTPIINPPQSGVLGMHAIKKRPVVVDDEIRIRPMMYVALSYDHRIIDGKEAVTFLKLVKECIEHPVRLVFEI